MAKNSKTKRPDKIIPRKRYIFQYIQALINSPGVSDAQKNEGLQRLQQMGVPSFIIQQGIDSGRGGAIRGIPTADPRGPTATDIRARAPSMSTYGDVRSVLAPGTSNIRVDQPDIGWPGEDLSGYSKTKFPAAEVLSPPVLANDFGFTPKDRNVVGRAAPPVSSYVRPASSFIHEDVKAAAQRRSRTPTRQVAQNDPAGLWRTFGTTSDYTGPTAAVQQDAGYQTPREARRRPTYNRVPETKKSSRRYQPFAEMINAPWGIV